MLVSSLMCLRVELARTDWAVGPHSLSCVRRVPSAADAAADRFHLDVYFALARGEHLVSSE